MNCFEPAFVVGVRVADVEGAAWAATLVYPDAEEERRRVLERVAGLENPDAQALLDLADRERGVDRHRLRLVWWEVAHNHHGRGLDRSLGVVPAKSQIGVSLYRACQQTEPNCDVPCGQNNPEELDHVGLCSAEVANGDGLRREGVVPVHVAPVAHAFGQVGLSR